MTSDETTDLNPLSSKKHDHKFALSFDNSEEFLEYLQTQGHTSHHVRQTFGYFKKRLLGKKFETGAKLAQYLESLPLDPYNTVKSARIYLNYLERYELRPPEIISHYRAFLKLRKTKPDVYVPSTEEVENNLSLCGKDSEVELVYLVLKYSGIRLVEAISFLSSFDKMKFQVFDNFVCYSIRDKRGSKNLNNVYLPLFVYRKLFHIEKNYYNIRKKYKSLGGSLSLKYLRKWNYNQLLYAGVPESVADFIQGRAGASVSASHYLGKSQQAEHWYGKFVENTKKFVE